MPRPPKNVVLGLPVVERTISEPDIEALLAAAGGDGPSAPTEQQQPDQPVIDAPTEQQQPDQPVIDAPTAVAPPTWNPIDSYVQDGKPVWLIGPDGQSAKAFWRETRAFDRATCKWVPITYWAVFNGGGGMIVPFEPIGWKPYDE